MIVLRWPSVEGGKLSYRDPDRKDPIAKAAGTIEWSKQDALWNREWAGEYPSVSGVGVSGVRRGNSSLFFVRFKQLKGCEGEKLRLLRNSS